MSHFVRNVVLKINNFWLKMKHVAVFVHLFPILFRRHKRHLWRVSQLSPPDRMRSSEQSCCSPHWNKSALDASLVRWGILWTCLTRTPQISLEVLSDPPLELEGLAWMRSELLCDLETWMNTELFPWWESDCRQPASQSQYFNSKAFYKAAQVHIMVRATHSPSVF